MGNKKTVILLGGGQSIDEGRRLGLFDKIKNEEVWSVNFAYKTLSFLPKRQIWLDVSFFKNNIDDLQKLFIQGVTCHTKSNNKYAGILEIKTYFVTRNPNENNDKIFIGRMGLSGFFALSLAVKEKYDIIYLLGYDFGKLENETKTHYYQDEINIISTGINHPELYLSNNRVKEEVKDFELFLKESCKIYNVSLKSNIPYFDKLSWEEFFLKIGGE